MKTLKMDTDIQKKIKIRNNSQLSLKDVIQSLVRVKRQPTRIYEVGACPQNIQELREARNRMGCSKDQNGRNQYMCIPNKNLTALWQFCFPGVMGLQEEGRCLVVNGDRKLTAVSCKDFKFGCPGKYYNQDVAYKNHGCQNINTEYRCYLAHPLCPPLNGTYPAHKVKLNMSKMKNAFFGIAVAAVNHSTSTTSDASTGPSSTDTNVISKAKTTRPKTTFSSIQLSMAEVQACPQSIEEVIAARKRKGCGDDEYGKNQFTCIPKYDFSGLVEFCNPGIIGLQERDVCVVLSKDYHVTSKSCRFFESGCPESPYYSNEFFKFPACQNIDTERRCYKYDPSCSKSLDMYQSTFAAYSSVPKKRTFTTVNILKASMAVQFLYPVSPTSDTYSSTEATTPFYKMRSSTERKFRSSTEVQRINRNVENNTHTTTFPTTGAGLGCAACFHPIALCVFTIFIVGCLICALIRYCRKKRGDTAARNGEGDLLNGPIRETEM